ncbi:DUF2953 domain-containing protein [Virgibacillus salinus]|uniref:DUF2953 domain-containing protein n=1 Tax=Virgibacillus salinus TaxID=553311 RepID=A0A1H1ASN7_9BACI|nr:DUF2953 domain-containing protein [Virgibacillus salinus]SDQ42748.1 Protein of unknown function [Virgibacillus salinus]
MMMLLIALMLVIILTLFSKIKVISTVILNQEKQTALIAVYFYRIRLMNKLIDLSSEESNEEKSIREILKLLHSYSNNLLQRMKDLNDVVTILLNRINFHKLSWNTHFGTGEASAAGMVSGGIWGTKGLILGLIYAKSNLKCDPVITVVPLFNQKYIESKFDCIVSIRIGQAIYGILKVIRKYPAKKEAII